MIPDPLALVGTTVAEKYRVDAAVGEGGFAIVYKATHLVWQRPVALKVFRALGEVREEQRDAIMQTFIAEGRLLADLSERSAVFVQSRDVATLMTPDGQWMPYLVLEWLEGQTLEDYLTQRSESGQPPSTFSDMMTLLQPIGEGLAIAHARGVAHRDVKPSNIFLVGKGADRTTKLLDLGIAKVVQDAQADLGGFRKTTGAVTSFTPMYGAPEQFARSNGPTGPWTDVFALTLVMLEIMSGRYALSGDDLTQIAWAACNPLDRPTPRALGLQVSDEVEAVFARALAVKTTDRFASVGELWEALRVASGGLVGLRGPSASLLPGVAVTGAPHLVEAAGNARTITAASSLPSLPMLPSSDPPKKGSPVAMGAIGVVAALALGGGALFFLTRGGHDGPTSTTSSTVPAPSGSVVGNLSTPDQQRQRRRPRSRRPRPPAELPRRHDRHPRRPVLHGLRRGRTDLPRARPAGAQGEAQALLHRPLRGEDLGLPGAQRHLDDQAQHRQEQLRRLRPPQGRRAQGVRLALHLARSEEARRLPDQLRRLLDGAVLLRRQEQAPAHRGGVGVRRAWARSAQVPLGRRSARPRACSTPAAPSASPGARRTRSPRPGCTPATTASPTRRRSARSPRASRATESRTWSATCGSGPPTGSRPTRRTRRAPRRRTRPARWSAPAG